MPSATPPARARSSAWARLLVVVALALAGCQSLTSDSAGRDDDGGDPFPPPPPPPGADAECVRDAECVPAGSTCCECPSFALPASSGWQRSCEDVACPAPEACGEVDAVCEQGGCALICRPILCDTVCEVGFAVDAAGCLVCACESAAPLPECTVDADCVEVPADCCGCSRGGADTAVPLDAADGFTGNLACEGDEACPDVDVCDRFAEPRCHNGSCALLSSGPPPPPPPPPDPDVDGGAEPSSPQPCGTTAYPTCPEGFACVLNDPNANDRTPPGVGVCVEQGI